jgi:nitrite reductase/ring-hydroxylating ferredoxin subunit
MNGTRLAVAGILVREGRCRNHGALFAPEDGLCLAGPCEGESLDPLRIARRGAGWALDGGGPR